MSSYYGSNVEQSGSCKESVLNKTAMFVSCSVVVSLALVFIIVKTIRHVYKPLRPRIKKTYVVHKNVSPTPLTCRPSTEQCEITIENCCNMNICDTVSANNNNYNNNNNINITLSTLLLMKLCVSDLNNSRALTRKHYKLRQTKKKTRKCYSTIRTIYCTEST